MVLDQRALAWPRWQVNLTNITTPCLSAGAEQPLPAPPSGAHGISSHRLLVARSFSPPSVHTCPLVLSQSFCTLPEFLSTTVSAQCD